MLGLHLKARTRILPPLHGVWGRFATRCGFERCVMLLYIFTVIMIESWLDFWLTATHRVTPACCPRRGTSFGDTTGD
ncbi:hypothetical protein CV770_31420 [Bradyrhizobium sp. AC87j1]|nr:hypothetical protein CV770_31420 [Bradyrhizobium sp. AC87j1]